MLHKKHKISLFFLLFTIIIFSILYFYNPFNSLKYDIPKVFFSLYGFSAWSIPLCSLISLFIIFLTEKINYIRLIFLNIMPLLFSIYCNIYNIKKYILTAPGGDIGILLNLIIKNYLLNKFLNTNIKVLYFLFFLNFCFILQVTGFLFLYNLLKYFLYKTKIIPVLEFFFYSIISWISYLLPFTKNILPYTPYSINMSILESVKYDIDNIKEIYNIPLNNNNYIPPCQILTKSFLNLNNKYNVNNNIDELELYAFNEAAKSLKFDLEIIYTYKGPILNTIVVKPGNNERISIIKSKEEEFARIFGKFDLRINFPLKENPFCISFEYENDEKKIISFISNADLLNKNKNNYELNLLLGVDTVGKPFIIDLTIIPHLLIAGTTGSGKSSIMHSLIMSILWVNDPFEISIVLIDPKHVEYTQYEKIPHLIFPITRSISEIENVLINLIKIMDERYILLNKFKVKNVKEFYSQYPERKNELSYIVIFIDEYADLIMQNSKIENYVISLTQKARAAGIHIILATQRPSYKIISGILKSNISSRIACKTASALDSRIIIEIDGAEKLLGNGDMLFLDSTGHINRLHGVYPDIIHTEEILKIIYLQKNTCNSIL